ncbi:hypothetical protein QL285_068519 [Trifolium repens]|jgi:hypothetical protein|nr:hypothetical protein QL285_068519 [Trifolium repens]
MKSSSSKVEEELGRGVILEAIVTLDKERKNSEEGESKEIKKIRKYLQRISRLNRRRQKKINVPKSGYDLTVTKILKRDTWQKTTFTNVSPLSNIRRTRIVSHGYDLTVTKHPQKRHVAKNYVYKRLSIIQHQKNKDHVTCIDDDGTNALGPCSNKLSNPCYIDNKDLGGNCSGLTKTQ